MEGGMEGPLQEITHHDGELFGGFGGKEPLELLLQLAEEFLWRWSHCVDGAGLVGVITIRGRAAFIRFRTYSNHRSIRRQQLNNISKSWQSLAIIFPVKTTKKMVSKILKRIAFIPLTFFTMDWWSVSIHHPHLFSLFPRYDKKIGRNPPQSPVSTILTREAWIESGSISNAGSTSEQTN